MTTQRLRDAWMRISARERWLIGLGTMLVVGVAGHAFAWEPLMRDLAITDRSLLQARSQVAGAQRAADEIAGLARETRTPRTADARAATERAVAAAGLRSDLTAIGVSEGRVRLTFAAIDFAALGTLVEVLARDEQLFVVEALLAARVVPGSVRAELALARPASQ